MLWCVIRAFKSLSPTTIPGTWDSPVMKQILIKIIKTWSFQHLNENFKVKLIAVLLKYVKLVLDLNFIKF